MHDITDDEAKDYLSTYGWVTIGQMLEGYDLKLLDTSVIALLTHRTAFYYQILRIPALNVMNGIILDQAQAYRVYVQKLFVDYLVSGHADVEDSQGVGMRDALEKARVDMLETSKTFDQICAERMAFIVESQRFIKAYFHTFSQLIKDWCDALNRDLSGKKLSVQHLYDVFVDAVGFTIQPTAWSRLESVIQQPFGEELQQVTAPHLEKILKLANPLREALDSYEETVMTLRVKLNQHRQAFYDEIIQVQTLLGQVVGFTIDETEDWNNRLAIMFDSDIGA